MQAVLDRQGVVKGLLGGSGLTPCGSLESNGAWKVEEMLHGRSGNCYSATAGDAEQA